MADFEFYTDPSGSIIVFFSRQLFFLTFACGYSDAYMYANGLHLENNGLLKPNRSKLYCDAFN